MTRIRVITVGVALAATVMLGVWSTAGPAAAQPAHPSQPAAASAVSAVHSPRSPLVPTIVQCNITLHRFKIWQGGCSSTTHEYTCDAGHQGNFPWFPRHAANGCIYRVWIYTQYNQGGTALCLSKHSSTGYLSTDWKSWRIVSNQDDC